MGEHHYENWNTTQHQNGTEQYSQVFQKKKKHTHTKKKHIVQDSNEAPSVKQAKLSEMKSLRWTVNLKTLANAYQIQAQENAAGLKFPLQV